MIKKTNIDLGLLLLRVSAGGFMLFAHGLPKLMKYETLSKNFADPIGVGPFMSYLLAMSSEFFLAGFVLLGLYVRASAIPLFITMAVAAFIVHGNDPFGDKELALMYMVSYATLFFTGGGKFSLDRLWRKNPNSLF